MSKKLLLLLITLTTFTNVSYASFPSVDIVTNNVSTDNFPEIEEILGPIFALGMLFLSIYFPIWYFKKRRNAPIFINRMHVVLLILIEILILMFISLIVIGASI